jgi:hypothetical protein
MSGIITTPVLESPLVSPPVLVLVPGSTMVVPDELPTLSVATGSVVDELPGPVVPVALASVVAPVVGVVALDIVPLPASSVGSATVADAPLVLELEPVPVPGPVAPVLPSLADAEVPPPLSPQPTDTIKPRTLTRGPTEYFIMIFAPT